MNSDKITIVIFLLTILTNSNGKGSKEYKGTLSGYLSSIFGKNVTDTITDFQNHPLPNTTLWEPIALSAIRSVATSSTLVYTSPVATSSSASTVNIEEDTSTTKPTSDAVIPVCGSRNATFAATRNKRKSYAKINKHDNDDEARRRKPKPTTIAPTTVPPRPARNRSIWDQLEAMKKTPITDDNVEEVSEELADLTEYSEEMTAEEVDSTADILQNITAVNSTETSVTSCVVETVNNLMKVNEVELEEAAASTGSTNRAIRSLETQLQFVDVVASNGTFKDVYSNIGVQVGEYSRALLQTGLTFIYSADDPSKPLSPENIFVHIGNNIDPENMTIHARISLPKSIGRTILRNTSRVSFVIFRSTALFKSRSLAKFNANQSEFDRIPNTYIISASVNARPIWNLSEHVMTSYNPIFTAKDEGIRNVTKATCVFWDFDADNGHGNWSRKGCRLAPPGSIHQYGCQCDHLTNFAILMDIYGNSLLTDYQDNVLEIMSYVGCSLSSACLGITLCTFITAKKLRKSQANRILSSLSASLLTLYLSFLLLLSLKPVTMATCGVIVGLVHYSLLCSACWMAVESFNMYLMVIRVFDRGGIPHFMLRAAILALGTPFIIVAVISGVCRQEYMSYSESKGCGFLKFWPLVGGVLIPIAILTTYDAVIFALVMRRLSRKVAGKQITKPKYLERLRRLQNATALIVLMGLTWCVGFLTAIQAANLAFQIIFIILNSFQGVFLFLFYCLRNPIARNHWRSMLCSRCKPTVVKTTVVSNISSSSGDRSRPRSPNRDSTSKESADIGPKIKNGDTALYQKVGLKFSCVSSKKRKDDTSVYTIELSSVQTSMISKDMPFDCIFGLNNDVIDNIMEELENIK